MMVVVLSSLGGVLGAGLFACPGFSAGMTPCHCPPQDRDLAMKSNCCCAIAPAAPAAETPVSLASRTEDSPKPDLRAAHAAAAGHVLPHAVDAFPSTLGAAASFPHPPSVPLFLKNATLLR